jgi:predicted acetyltransferase
MSQPPITLRSAQAEDLSRIVNLDRLSFGPLLTNAEIEREWYSGTLDWPGHAFFLAVQTGREVGAYVQLNFQTWLAGRSLPMMGIGGVAVAPQSRGQGVARVMIEHALEQARSQQVPIAMLYPFQHGFYRKLGWAWVGQPQQYRVACRDLPSYGERSGILPYELAHMPALKAIYAQVAPQHNGWLQRQGWQWLARLKPVTGREIYVYEAAGEIQGYAILQFLELGPRQLLCVGVQEWVALTSAAYRGIVGFLAALRDQVDTVVWNTYAGDPFPHLLKEQRQDPSLAAGSAEFGLTHRFGELGGGFMWRLVDLKRALELRSIPPGDPFALTLRVNDPVWGAQVVTAEFADGQIHCHDRATAPAITLSIEHLTALFAGARRSVDLLWTGELAWEGEAAQAQDLLPRLDAAWQTAAPFCWDFF